MFIFLSLNYAKIFKAIKIAFNDICIGLCRIFNLLVKKKIFPTTLNSKKDSGKHYVVKV